MAITEAQRAMAHSVLLSTVQALAVKFEDKPEASEVAALLERMQAKTLDDRILEDATRYCTSERCLGLKIAN